jgi:hypothetical protein
MRRTLLAAACILLLPALATAQTYTASLSGAEVSGFGTITISGDDIGYNILVSGMSPTTAVLTDGSIELDLEPAFVAGSAFGSVTDATVAAAILSDASSWDLDVGDGTNTISGSLGTSSGGETVVYFPVSAAIRGAQGTNFRTDARIVNRTGEAATATVEYYPEGAAGNSGPAVSETVDITANEQLVLVDFVADFFGVSNGKGGVRITSESALSVSSRVYNDQSDVGDGTFGLYVDAIDMNQAYRSGLVPFLQNRRANSGEGFRGAVGWFNPTSSTVTITLLGWDTDGTYLGETTREVAGLAQEQFSIQQLWSALAGHGDMYVTYSADGDIFVYGTITDNISGDGTYIPATQSP